MPQMVGVPPPAVINTLPFIPSAVPAGKFLGTFALQCNFASSYGPQLLLCMCVRACARARVRARVCVCVPGNYNYKRITNTELYIFSVE